MRTRIVKYYLTNGYVTDPIYKRQFKFLWFWITYKTTDYKNKKIMKHAPIGIAFLQPLENSKAEGLHLNPITLRPDYVKEWNITLNDFLCLTKNNILIRDTLYRIGGLNNPDLKNDKYFCLIKHSEAYYSDEITKDTAGKPHLESQWCIIDQNGIEKVVCKPYSYPYIVKNSVIYFVDKHCFNIETGECYGDSDHSLESTEFIFLNNKYAKDENKRGVMKINKLTGSYELFK